MRFDEFSLKDGVASSTGHIETTIYNEDSISCKSLRKTHFDDENGLVRLLETDTDTAKVHTWKMDNLVLWSRLDILDKLPTQERSRLCSGIIFYDYRDSDHYQEYSRTELGESQMISNLSHMMVISYIHVLEKIDYYCIAINFAAVNRS